MPFDLGENFQGKSSKRRSKAPVGLWLMLLQHPVRCVSDWFFMPEIQQQWSLINRFKKMCAKLMLFFAAENGMFQAHLWVCLKIGKTPKPNGFAAHYPYQKWLFHWEY